MGKRVGVVGLGEMGSGLARNLIAAGFAVAGFDLSGARMKAFEEMGGIPAMNAAGVGVGASAVFIMVMNGRQARSVVFGDDGLSSSMAAGSTIILTATINAREARELADDLKSTGIRMIDSPVSGGFPGAQSGTLTMMAAADQHLLSDNIPIMEAVSGTSTSRGPNPNGANGQGLPAVAHGLDPDRHIRSHRAGGEGGRGRGRVPQGGFDIKCGIDYDKHRNGQHCRRKIQQYRQSHFNNAQGHDHRHGPCPGKGRSALHRRNRNAVFRRASKHPEGDNWAVTKVLEDIVGTGLRRSGESS